MKSPRPIPPTLLWRGRIPGRLEILDQRDLPHRETILIARSPSEVWDAIQTLAVRGAPAIGIAGAYGFLLGLQRSRARNASDLLREARITAEYLGSARPTAANLVWALRRMLHRAETLLSKSPPSPGVLRQLLREAQSIHREDAASCRRIGELGAAFLPKRARVLTHCNAGSLATGGEGTALAIVYRAVASGKSVEVFADETRPLLQGARLTCWELSRRGIATTLLSDGAAASLIRGGSLDAVLVGADRIASNGDTANKIGTYSLALLCREHGVPFYVAAPRSTFDLSLASGSSIPIEMRQAKEVLRAFERTIAPPGVNAYNPAFDVTPAHLITAIVTDRGIVRRPTREKIQKLFGEKADTSIRRSRKRKLDTDSNPGATYASIRSEKPGRRKAGRLRRRSSDSPLR